MAIKQNDIYKVYWTNLAKDDLDEIINYISQDSINTAIKKLKQIQKSAYSLNNYPKKGRIVPELKQFNIIRYRELILNPWRIIYKIDKKDVYVLAVIDGRRNVEDILLNRFLNK